MRDADRKRLEEPLLESDQRRPEDQFSEALQLSMPNIRALYRAILDDLDTKNLGVSWWKGFVGTKRCILIGDQLTLVARGIEINLTEAKLHLLEALGYLDDCGRNPRLEVFGDVDHKVYPQFRRAHSAAEYLPLELAQL